jgi:hypothetical protein
MTFVFKKLFPAFWFGFLLLSFVLSVYQNQWARDPTFFAVLPLMVLFGIFAFRKWLWPLADEVRDGGSFLVVRKGGTEQRVMLTDIINVDMSSLTKPRRLSLRLRTPGKFGDEILFLPKMSGLQLNPFSRNPVAEALIKRVDVARLGAQR